MKAFVIRRPIIFLTLVLVAFAGCSGAENELGVKSSATVSDVTYVKVSFGLTFPDGSSASAGSVSGLPANVSRISLTTIPSTGVNIHNLTIPNDTLWARLRLDVGTTGFYVDITTDQDGVKYVGAATATINAGQSTANVTINLIMQASANAASSPTINAPLTGTTSDVRMGNSFFVEKNFVVEAGSTSKVSVTLPDNLLLVLGNLSSNRLNLRMDGGSGSVTDSGNILKFNISWTAPDAPGTYTVALFYAEILKLIDADIAVTFVAHFNVVAKPNPTGGLTPTPELLNGTYSGNDALLGYDTCGGSADTMSLPSVTVMADNNSTEHHDTTLAYGNDAIAGDYNSDTGEFSAGANKGTAQKPDGDLFDLYEEVTGFFFGYDPVNFAGKINYNEMADGGCSASYDVALTKQ